MQDALFSHIERLQRGRPWGDFLDAGTGSHSLRWIGGLATDRWTAVTGEEWRVASLEKEVERTRRPRDRIVLGDWADPALLHGEAFDTVLADYLLGAVDRHAPYLQYRLFERLRPHVRGDLYVVGLEPSPESTDSPGGRIVLEIERLRDASILLAGHRCHREYPLEWALAAVERAGFRVEDAQSFPIVRGAKFIDEQLDICVRKLPLIAPKSLAKALERSIGELRDRAHEVSTAQGGLRFGEDYVIAARVA